MKPAIERIADALEKIADALSNTDAEIAEKAISDAYAKSFKQQTLDGCERFLGRVE